MLLGHYLPRSSGPAFFFSQFLEVIPVAVAFPELSWVPRIHAWMGHPGWQCAQTSSDVALGLGDIRFACVLPGARGLGSLSRKSGPLSRMEGWGPASGVQSSIRDLGTPSCTVSLLKSCLSQGRVSKFSVTPEECGSGPSWCLEATVRCCKLEHHYQPGAPSHSTGKGSRVSLLPGTDPT